MFGLTRQVQIAADIAKNGSARLAGVEAPRYEDNETTIDELKTRHGENGRLSEDARPEEIDRLPIGRSRSRSARPIRAT